MGFRFKKSIKIAPGLKINLSKSGMSTSLGKKGATINFSRKGMKETIGVPGTGMSYQTDKSTGGFWFIVIFLAICAIWVLAKQ